MTFDEKYDFIADRYEAIQGRYSYTGQWREWSIPDRTVYFVHDVHGVTINAGLPAWISYHGQSFQYADVIEAIAAFQSLNLDRAAAAIEACLKIYQKHGNKFEDDFEGYDFSGEISDHETEIYDALYDYIQQPSRA